MRDSATSIDVHVVGHAGEGGNGGPLAGNAGIGDPAVLAVALEESKAGASEIDTNDAAVVGDAAV